MGVTFGELDWAGLYERIPDAEAGDPSAGAELARRAVEIVGRTTSWQWVIHGDTGKFREGAVRYLCGAKKFKKALQFAMCGRGDSVSRSEDWSEVKVSPRGCGLRFCPRCSRRSGHRFLGRIGGHLEQTGHGEIWHFVLTQPVRGGEGVVAARARFERAWKKWYRCLRKVGMKSALLTEHVKPRETWGWHFHGHCVVEFKDDTDVEVAGEKLEAAWQKACLEEKGREKDLFRRRVCGPGPALGAGRFGGQGEFWQEEVGSVQRVLQYAIRDVVQGCETWVSRLADPEEIAAFAKVIDQAKLHRLFGVWRKVAAGSEAEETAGSESDVAKKVVAGSKKDDTVWHLEGSMEHVLSEARAGATGALRLLTTLRSLCWNRGETSRRLGIVVESVWGQRRAG